jgi:tRNA(fMet)-specific endonuclease VapC
MRRYLLDTGTAQGFINRRDGIPERADAVRQGGNRIGICTPVLGELWAGIEGSATRERNTQRLRRALSRLIVWPYTNDATTEYGRVFAELRRIGRPMQQIDIMIAAIAFSLGNCTVVSDDSDLHAVPGLVVESWTTAASSSGLPG